MNPQQRIPKLRFPEFEQDGKWEEKTLGRILQSISNGLSIEQCKDKSGYRVTRIETISNKAIDLEKVGYVVTDQDISEYKLAVGDILLSNINSLSHIGKAVYVDKEYNLYHGMNLLRLIVDSSNSSSFVFYQIDSDRVKKSIERRANKSVNQASINQTDLKKITLFIPPSLKEQQKIASCLSSADEVIGAHVRKLALLQAHKKGLMQQLFPQAGAKTPRLRFPEFQQDGAWEEKTLGEVAEFVNEKTPLEEISIDSYISTENLLPDYTGITAALKLPTSGSFTKYREGDVLVSNIRPYLKKVWFSDKEGASSNDVFVVRSKSDIQSLFLSFLLKNDNFINYVMVGAKGVKMPRGDKSLIKRYPILFPSLSEQQKIADCLSSLDRLMAAMNKKITLLQQHKKGLMQQLFPPALKGRHTIGMGKTHAP